MQPTKKQFDKFTLNKGVQFSQCVAPSKTCADPRRLDYYTKKTRVGELDIISYDSSPEQAVFYSPNRAVCEKVPGDCELQVIFKGKELTSLLNDNLSSTPSSKSSPPSESQNDTQKTSPVKDLSMGGEASRVDPGAERNQDLLNLPLPLFFVLPAVAFVYILYKISLKHFGVGTPGSYRGSSAKRSNTPSINQSTVRNVASSQQGGVSSEEIRRQLLPIIDKLNSVSSRLSQVETDMFAITLQLQQPSIKASSSASSLLTNNVNSTISQFIPPPPPRPLSLELIKEAILTNNYSLISSYPHHFVSETHESRQGLEDVKRFAIEGDQSQASGRTQSEFIVIPLFNELYLIPNILPNAADPARTIKRHADKNSIYRNGQGSNLLNLVSLAVVQRNGDRYELANAGQVA